MKAYNKILLGLGLSLNQNLQANFSRHDIENIVQTLLEYDSLIKSSNMSDKYRYQNQECFDIFYHTLRMINLTQKQDLKEALKDTNNQLLNNIMNKTSFFGNIKDQQISIACDIANSTRAALRDGHIKPEQKKRIAKFVLSFFRNVLSTRDEEMFEEYASSAPQNSTAPSEQSEKDDSPQSSTAPSEQSERDGASQSSAAPSERSERDDAPQSSTAPSEQDNSAATHEFNAANLVRGYLATLFEEYEECSYPPLLEIEEGKVLLVNTAKIALKLIQLTRPDIIRKTIDHLVELKRRIKNAFRGGTIAAAAPEEQEKAQKDLAQCVQYIPYLNKLQQETNKEDQGKIIKKTRNEFVQSIKSLYSLLTPEFYSEVSEKDASFRTKFKTFLDFKKDWKAHLEEELANLKIDPNAANLDQLYDQESKKHILSNLKAGNSSEKKSGDSGEKKSNKTKYIVASVIVASIALIAIAGFFVYKAKSKKTVQI